MEKEQGYGVERWPIQKRQADLLLLVEEFVDVVEKLWILTKKIDNEGHT
jgi:hypothetical protein